MEWNIHYKDKKAFTTDLKAIYNALNKEVAAVALDQLEQNWGSKYPNAIKSGRSNWEDLTVFFDFPLEIRKIIYTTNLIENLNEKIRKYTKGKGSLVEHQSGKRVGRTKISKQGNSHIRRILYMQALHAVRRNVPVCRALSERLTGKGKKKMIAYVAVQKKLLMLIYTLWKKDEAWQENHYSEKQPASKEAILSLEVGASLLGVLAADQNKAAPTSRATPDEHPAPIGQGLSFR